MLKTAGLAVFLCFCCATGLKAQAGPGGSVCSLSITCPAADTLIPGHIQLAWDVACAGSGAILSLYWDAEGDTTGTLITTVTPADGPGTFFWNAVGFTSLDTFFIYGTLISGTDTAIAYSAGRITVYDVAVEGEGIGHISPVFRGPERDAGAVARYGLDGRRCGDRAGIVLEVRDGVIKRKSLILK